MRPATADLRSALGDRYILERDLGQGGMATVYLAQDTRHHRPVAIKVLRPDLASLLGPERFLREVQTTATLQHPHILPLFDSGTFRCEAGAPGLYYVMPYVAGESLRQRLLRETQLPIEDALRITSQVASALDYAHACGIIHRDVKPENILLTDDEAVVADFGIARAIECGAIEQGSGGSAPRLTETGFALGTPAYMSPEQASGTDRIDARTDIYALACVLYEMLAGEPPFRGPTAQAVAARHAVDSPPSVRTIRPTVPEQVEHAIARAMAKVPADRYRSAREFSQAIVVVARPAVPALARSWSRLRRPRALWLAAIATALAAGIGAALWQRPARGGVIAPASVIAVLPFTPSGSDSALTRLGRDLVLTLSTTLDGVGDIRTVDAQTVLAQIRNSTTSSSIEQDVAFGRRFRAGSIVHGSLARTGDRVRLDVGLYATDSAAPLARVTVTAPPDSVAALTDSTARSLLSQIWRRGVPPSPSLDGVLRTRSIPALRAFLAGEHAMVEGRWRDAVTAYDSAIAADSSFWLGYWRDLYTRIWANLELDSTMVRACRGHRLQLPERERLLLQCGWVPTDTLSVALARGHEVTSRFPDYWIGWLHYGDMLVHGGPLLGHSRSEALAALQTAVKLNPRLVSAWEHLVWMAQQARDTAAANQGIRALTGLDAGPRLAEWMNADELLQFRLVDRLERGDAAGADSLIDRAAHGIVANRTAGWTEMDAVLNGFPRAQIALSRAVVRLAPESEQAAWHRRIIALSWTSRGAWDSALAQVAASFARHRDPSTRLDGYRLAALGAWVGALPVGEAQARRPTGRVVEELTASDRAELAWSDGMVAVAERNRRALAEARAALQRSGDTTRAVLDRSLGAFELWLSSEGRRAADSLAALEWRRAETGYAGEGEHIFSVPVNRIAAADWLLTSGDTVQAERLLHWNEAYLSTDPAIVFVGLVALQRAQIAQARGLGDEALRHYRDFLTRYDLPTPRHRHLVEEATAAVRRLSEGARTGEETR
jgi:TolB-like protein